MFPILRAAAPGLLAVAVALAAAPASADSSTKLVLGLDMTFGRHVTPEIYTGLAQTSTDSSNHVSGVKALAYWDFARSLAPSKVKVLGIVAGRKNWQPELGAGYSFADRNGLFSAGVSSHNVTGGVEFSPTTGLAPYVGVQIPGKY